MTTQAMTRIPKVTIRRDPDSYDPDGPRVQDPTLAPVVEDDPAVRAGGCPCGGTVRGRHFPWVDHAVGCDLAPAGNRDRVEAMDFLRRAVNRRPL